MNEMDTYYENTSQLSSALGDIARREGEMKSSAIGTKSALDDTDISLTQAKASKEEAEGGQTTGAGVLTSTAFNVVKGQVQKSIKSALQSKVQSKIDEIKQNKIDSSADGKEPAPSSAGARDQPNIEITGNETSNEIRGIKTNLSKRINNMDTDSKNQVLDNYKDSTGNTNPQTPQEVDVLQQKVIEQEKDPTTKFSDEELDTTADSGTTNVSTGISGGRVATTGTTTGQTPNVSSSASTDVSENLKTMTDEGMSQLSDKLGVDFGSLSSEDVGTALSGSLTEAGGSMLGSLGGALGTTLEYLGPIGMIAGIVTAGFGISKSLKEMNQMEQKQTDIRNLASNINNMGGMSFGSLATSAMDTSQVRSGGATANF